MSERNGRQWTSPITAIGMILVVVGLWAPVFTGCEEHDPATNTATSGKLVVYIDNLYEPLFKPLVDSFKNRTRAQSIDFKAMDARDAVQAFLNTQIADTARTDTSTTFALIIGRKLLEDELKAVRERGLEERMFEVPIATDGLAIATARESAFTNTTHEKLVAALQTESRPGSMLQDDADSDPVRFLFTSPNSSPYSYVRNRLLDGESPAAPSKWLSTSDSLIDMVAADEGLGIISWYRAHRDSARVRTLKVGFTDTNDMVHQPVRVHPSSLVMNIYPMELEVVGYTFSGVNSLANGFLSWVSRSDAAQHYLAYEGLEPENVKMELVPSDE